MSNSSDWGQGELPNLGQPSQRTSEVVSICDMVSQNALNGQVIAVVTITLSTAGDVHTQWPRSMLPTEVLGMLHLASYTVTTKMLGGGAGGMNPLNK